MWDVDECSRVCRFVLYFVWAWLFSCISFSARIVCSRHDSRHGPKSDRKRILPSVLMYFPCPTRLSPVDNHFIMHLPLWLFLPFFSRFCISQGRTHNFFSPSSCYRARPLNGEPRGSDDTRTYEKKKFSITPHPNKTNSFVVVRTAHINSLVEQSIITACNHAQLTGLFTKHWAYKMNDT